MKPHQVLLLSRSSGPNAPGSNASKVIASRGPSSTKSFAPPSARRNRFTVTGDDRDRDETPPALAGEVAHERALGAQGQSVTRVLHIRPDHEASVVGDAGCADADVRIGRVGAFGRLDGVLTQDVPGDFGKRAHRKTVHFALRG